MSDDYQAGFLDGMAAAVDALRRIPLGGSGPTEGLPSMILDHPTPAVVYHPERVGFYQLPDETD